ncbi:MAG: C-terminal helicase domain-containing protein, partial [Chlamydiota bacterium]|nr:C-terminal helicase domain-containing protein [Chlamydiota bacterium]
DFTKRGFRFCYLDGSTQHRQEEVDRFNTSPSIPIFLVSLKAGGTGLNLQSADTVIHYDMWWNPALQKQGTDRVYRMGQKRAVSLYQLVTMGTIEEKIIHMHQKKSGLVEQVLSDEGQIMGKLTWEDVLELLDT